MHNINKKIF